MAEVITALRSKKKKPTGYRQFHALEARGLLVCEDGVWALRPTAPQPQQSEQAICLARPTISRNPRPKTKRRSPIGEIVRLHRNPVRPKEIRSRTTRESGLRLVRLSQPSHRSLTASEPAKPLHSKGTPLLERGPLRGVPAGKKGR